MSQRGARLGRHERLTMPRMYDTEPPFSETEPRLIRALGRSIVVGLIAFAWTLFFAVAGVPLLVPFGGMAMVVAAILFWVFRSPEYSGRWLPCAPSESVDLRPFQVSCPPVVGMFRTSRPHRIVPLSRVPRVVSQRAS